MVECIPAIAIINRGLENVCAGELREFGCKNIVIKDEIVFFEVNNYGKLCELCYSLRCVNKIMLFLAELPVENFESAAVNILSNIKFKTFLEKETTFAVRYEKSFGVKEDGRIIAGVVGEYIFENVGAKVNLVNPDVQFFCFIQKDFVFLGVDFSGEDLGKRDYRIFLGHDDLRGSVAFGLLKLAGFDSGRVLLDSFCRTGAVCVEAGLLSVNQSPHFYSKNKFAFLKLPFVKIDVDKFFSEIDSLKVKSSSKILCYDASFPNINAAKKNAKIAGVIDVIDFSRSDVEWLDLKFDEHSIDVIVTYPLQVSKTVPLKKIEVIYDWFFKNGKFLLQKNGCILTLVKRHSEVLLNSCAQKYGFVVKEKHLLWQGGQEFFIIIYSPKN